LGCPAYSLSWFQKASPTYEAPALFLKTAHRFILSVLISLILDIIIALYLRRPGVRGLYRKQG